MPDENTDQDQDTQDHSELVSVYVASQETMTQVVIALLESAGIECMEASIEAVQDIYPGVGGTRVLVSATDAEEAKRIIAENKTISESDIQADE